ncbi:MAG: hypothetical protein KC505_07180, partial [Myxococcales bacterium]|nr:hypothetical protein [Myxococcales bacterium]
MKLFLDTKKIIGTIIFFSFSLKALDIGDRVRFFNYVTGFNVTGKVCEIYRTQNKEKVFFVQDEVSQKKFQLPKGQFLILESALEKSITRNEDNLAMKIDEEEFFQSLIPQNYSYDSFSTNNLLKQACEKLRNEREKFSDIQNLIFLAEGGEENWSDKSWHLSMSEAMLKVFPEKRILRTDLDIKTFNSKDFKLAQLPINNTRRFAPEIQSSWGKADAVIMLRGLCLCGIINDNISFSCGGIHVVDKKEMARFLMQVISVIDWNNPQAFAYLDGRHFSSRIQNVLADWGETRNRFKTRIKRQNQSFFHWEKVARKVCKSFNRSKGSEGVANPKVDFEIRFSPEGDFQGLYF